MIQRKTAGPNLDGPIPIPTPAWPTESGYLCACKFDDGDWAVMHVATGMIIPLGKVGTTKRRTLEAAELAEGILRKHNWRMGATSHKRLALKRDWEAAVMELRKHFQLGRKEVGAVNAQTAEPK